MLVISRPKRHRSLTLIAQEALGRSGPILPIQNGEAPAQGIANALWGLL